MKILTHNSCIVSARLLRDALVKIIGKPILITKNPLRIKGPFIRYGNALPTNIKDTNYNSAEFIRLVSNKANFSMLMKENDIYSPIYFNKEKPKNFPVLIRKTLTSLGGYGIVVCPSLAVFEANWKNTYVWTPFVKTQFELRVHVLGNKVVKILKKRFIGVDGEEDGDEIKEPNLPIRNLNKGYHYQSRELLPYQKVMDLVEKLSPILNGKFYTLDIGWDSENKKYFVFEANSGSGLNTQTVELYADYLAREFML